MSDASEIDFEDCDPTCREAAGVVDWRVNMRTPNPALYGYSYAEWIELKYHERPLAWQNGTKKEPMLHKLPAAKKQPFVSPEIIRPRASAKAPAPHVEASELAVQETAEASQIWEIASQFVIQTKEDIEIASETIVDAKTRWKKLDAKEKEITAPMLASLAATRDLFRTPKEYLTRIETYFKTAIANHAQAEAEANRKAIAAASQAVAAGNVQATSQALGKVTDLRSTAGAAGVTTREVWDFEVVDVTALPAGYLLPNEKLIRHDMGQGKRDLPGVRYFQRTTVAARTKPGVRP